MAKLPAVEGLLKHQLYYRDPRTGRDQGAVVTLWTWRNEDPVPGARITYEVGAIAARVVASDFRNATSTQTIPTWIKSWDMGTSPPVRVAAHRIWPQVSMLGAAGTPLQATAVIALRTQAAGSAVRNRLNGRIHHPYPANGFNANGTWGSANGAQILAAWVTMWNVLKPAADPNAGQWVVPCFFEAGVLRPGGPLLPAVNHVLLRPEPGALRSRLYHPGPYARGA